MRRAAGHPSIVESDRRFMTFDSDRFLTSGRQICRFSRGGFVTSEEANSKNRPFLGSATASRQVAVWYAACSRVQRGGVAVPPFRLQGFTNLDCGCLVSRYHEAATDRDVRYVEEKGTGCRCVEHRRNQTLTATTPDTPASVLTTAHAS